MSENKYSFRFVNIDVVAKTIAPHPDNFQGAFYNFDITTEASVNSEKNYVIQFVKVSVRDGDNQEPLATFTIACIFEIANFDEVIKPNEEGAYSIPKELELYLKSASISTIRGIIWSELKGSYLHYAIMPIVDLSTFTAQPENVITNKIKTVLE